MTKALLIFTFAIVGSSLTMAADTQALSSTRQDPGGADEQDLKVQPELKPPTAKIDRRTMDQKVLQSFLRKTGQPAKPSKAKPKQ